GVLFVMRISGEKNDVLPSVPCCIDIAGTFTGIAKGSGLWVKTILSVCSLTGSRFTKPTFIRKLPSPPSEKSAASVVLMVLVGIAGKLCDVVPLVPGCGLQIRDDTYSDAVGSAPKPLTPVTRMAPRPDWPR